MKFKKQEYPIYKANNIKNGKISTLDLALYLKNDNKGKWVAKQNDILMAVRSGSKQLVGKTAIVGNLKMKTSFGAFMSVIRPYIRLLHFYELFFSIKSFQKSAWRCKHNYNFSSYSKMLKETLLPLPPLAEQNELLLKLNEPWKGWNLRWKLQSTTKVR